MLPVKELGVVGIRSLGGFRPPGPSPPQPIPQVDSFPFRHFFFFPISMILALPIGVSSFLSPLCAFAWGLPCFPCLVSSRLNGFLWTTAFGPQEWLSSHAFRPPLPLAAFFDYDWISLDQLIRSMKYESVVPTVFFMCRFFS